MVLHQELSLPKDWQTLNYFCTGHLFFIMVSFFLGGGGGGGGGAVDFQY